MDTKLIFNFLRDIAANNNRPWFQEHKAEYEKAKAEFEKGVEEAINTISKFDPSISHLTVKDCCYRFYRDTRFSLDKSPYKRHFGAYISAHGKKSLHGGYYIHLQPGHCLLAIGCLQIFSLRCETRLWVTLTSGENVLKVGSLSILSAILTPQHGKANFLLTEKALA